MKKPRKKTWGFYCLVFLTILFLFPNPCLRYILDESHPFPRVHMEFGETDPFVMIDIQSLELSIVIKDAPGLPITLNNSGFVRLRNATISKPSFNHHPILRC